MNPRFPIKYPMDPRAPKRCKRGGEIGQNRTGPKPFWRLPCFFDFLETLFVLEKETQKTKKEKTKETYEES